MDRPIIKYQDRRDKMLATTFTGTLFFFSQFGAAIWIVSGAGCITCKQQKCDGNDNCLDGCIPGFAGRTCSHRCPPNCIDSICYYDDDTGTYPCSMGCSHGYYGFQCNTPCQSLDKDGKCDRFSGTTPDCKGHRYGEKCNTSCQVKCGGSACDNTGTCFQEVCKPGRFGSDCDKSCDAECEGCHRDSGQCLKPKSKRFKEETGSTLETNENWGYWNKACGVLTLIFLCMILIAVWTIVYQIKTNFKSLKAIGQRHNASSPETKAFLVKRQ